MGIHTALLAAAAGTALCLGGTGVGGLDREPANTTAQTAVGTTQPASTDKTKRCSTKIIHTHGNKGVSLTFDDGPSEHTRKLLKTLDRYNTPATFFILGVQARQHKNLVRKQAQQGHAVANHSQTHSYNPTTIAAEIPSMNRLIRKLTGTQPQYFRAPGLTQSPVINAAARKANLCQVTHDYDIGDWETPRISSWEICKRVVAHSHKGSVILLHDGIDHQQTVDAVPCIIKGIRAKHLNIVPLAENIGTPKP